MRCQIHKTSCLFDADRYELYLFRELENGRFLSKLQKFNTENDDLLAAEETNL